MAEGNDGRASWLVPAVVGAAVTLIGTSTTFYLTSSKDRREHDRAVAAVRMQILESPSTASDLRRARITLDYVLRPIDDPQMFEQFSTSVLEFFAEQAPQLEQPQDSPTLYAVAPPITGDIVEWIAKLSGPERLAASNSLILKAQDNEPAVVDALIGHIRPPQDRLSYRVNLYIAFTLARLQDGWSGTDAQRDQIASLQTTRNFRDPTFRKHVTAALENWQRR